MSHLYQSLRFVIATVLLHVPVIIAILQVDGTTTNNTSSLPFPHSHLADYMDILCPYNTICRDGEPRKTIDDDRFGSCCQECSCDETCGLTESCCFPELDVHNVVDRRRQECITASTTPYGAGDGNDFYMVTDRYPDGSGENCGDENVTCGMDETATPLGSLYPVTSKKTGRIYKNIKCAKCHGVSRKDIVVWDAILMCEYRELIRPDIGTFVDILDNGHRYQNCEFYFYYPGRYADIKSEKCFENTVHSCGPSLQPPPDNYKIPEQLNMTEAEVQSACLSSFLSPFLVKYFNVFCFICNGYSLSRYDRVCGKDDPGRRRHTSGDDQDHFTALLDPNVVEKKAEKDHNDKGSTEPPPMACRLRSNMELVLDTSDCRPILCPSGQIRINGNCIYPTGKLYTNTFAVAINLTPKETLDVSSLENLKTRLNANVLWTDLITAAASFNHFTLNHIVYKANSIVNSSRNVVAYIWAKFIIHTKKQTFKEIVEDIQEGLAQDWTIDLNGSTVHFVPTLSEFASIERNKNTSLWRPRYGSIGSYASYPNRFVGDYVLTLIYFRNFYVWAFLIAKPYLCYQVSLKVGEYTLDEKSGVMYVNSTGKLFSSVEFSVGIDANGNYVPRICLAEAGFDVRLPASGAYLARISYTRRCLFVILALTSYEWSLI